VSGVFKREKDIVKHHADEAALPPVPDLPTAQASQPTRHSDSLAENGVIASPGLTVNAAGNDGTGPSEPGTLRVTILYAKDLFPTDIKPYVIVRVGGEARKTKHAHKTSTPEWNESFSFSAGALTAKLFVSVFEHKTLGRDRLLGEAEIDIWQHIQPPAMLSAEVSSELHEGQGVLRVRLDFDADIVLQGTSSSSMEHTQSIASPSRFSLRSRRPGPDPDDDKD